MADSTAFPPSTGAVRRWSTTFNPSETFGRYINHVRKAAILRVRDDDWLTPDIRLLDNIIRSAHDKRFVFPNFITTSDVARIILDHGWKRNMGTIAYLSYLSPPSGPRPRPYNLR